METTQRTPRRRIALVALILIAAVAATTNVHADETKWLLAPPTNANTGTTANNHGRPEKLTDSNSSHKMLRTVGSSLAIVLGTFLLVSTLFRKPTQQRQTNNMLETLGAIQVTPRVKLHLVRFGERLLVLHLAPERSSASPRSRTPPKCSDCSVPTLPNSRPWPPMRPLSMTCCAPSNARVRRSTPRGGWSHESIVGRAGSDSQRDGDFAVRWRRGQHGSSGHGNERDGSIADRKHVEI